MRNPDRRRGEIAEKRFALPADALDDLATRLARTRLPAHLGSGWEQGVPAHWLRSLLEDWRAFGPAVLQRRLDGLRQLHAEVDGHMVYVLVADGQGPNPLPLLLTPGWPGSLLEHLRVLPLLADPAAHGADPPDAFTVIIPSLPGYGFSRPPPPTGLTGRQVAGMWHALMASGLGHERFVAHGSDLANGVTAWLARDHPEGVRAIRLATPGFPPAPTRRTQPGMTYAAAAETLMAEEGGYAHEHATKPATLGAACRTARPA